MSLPNFKQILPNPHLMTAGHPVTFNILKERLRPSGPGQMMPRDQTPFIHSSHSNVSFTPQKAGKSSAAAIDSRLPKPPKAPEKPIMPYMRYSKKQWETVKTNFPELKLWEIGKKIGMLWRELPDEEKQTYIDEYELEKTDYEKALKSYHNSPAYLTYMSTKSKKIDPSDIHEMPRSSSKSQQDRRVDIQPAEDDEDQDDGYSFKQVAYSRYMRNHRLINEIFSDTIVPDVRSVVTTQRMHVLKRQVQSLAMHQMKLQAELQQIEEKFDSKKMKFMESSDLFQDELKKHCKPAVDDETFTKMVERQFEAMKRERMRVIEEQNKPPAAQQSSASAVPATMKPAEEIQVQGNSAQPAIENSEQPPSSETQSTAEPMDIEAPIKQTATTETIVEEMKPQVEEAKPINHDPVEAPKESEVTQLTPVESAPPVITQLAVPEPSPNSQAPVSTPMEISPPQTTSVAALHPPAVPSAPTPLHSQEGGPAPNVTVNPSMHAAPYGYPMQGPRPSYYGHPMPPYGQPQGYPNYPYGHHMPPYQQNYHMNQPPYDPQGHPAYPQPPQGAPLHPIHTQLPVTAAPSSVSQPTAVAVATGSGSGEGEEKNNDEKVEDEKVTVKKEA